MNYSTLWTTVLIVGLISASEVNFMNSNIFAQNGKITQLPDSPQTTVYSHLNGTSSINSSKTVVPETVKFEFNENPPLISEERLEKQNLSERDHLQPFLFENINSSSISPGPRPEIQIGSPHVMNTSTLKQSNSTPIINETSARTRTGLLQVVTDVAVFNPNTVRAIKNEPSVANNGQLIFYAANHFQAFSPDGGANWGFADPKQDFPTYCCDQDVIYDPIHNVFILSLMGHKNINGENVIRIQLSSDLFNWIAYDIKPTDINGTWFNQFFDYPQLAISNNFVYITSNIFHKDGNYTESVIMRFDTNSLIGGQLGKIEILIHGRGTITPVQGAKEDMYFASILGSTAQSGTLRIYLWPEIYTNARQGDVEVPPFVPANSGNMICPDPIGSNWCGNAYTIVTGGWVINNTLGFMWNADKLALNFPYPYVYSVVLNPDPASPSGFTVVDNPIIYSTKSAVIEGYASPNGPGDLGFIAFNGGPNSYPSIIAGATTPAGDFLNWYTLTSGTHGPYSQVWGDYIRIRADSGRGSIWVASGFTLQGGSTEQFIEPRFYALQLLP